MDMPENKIHFFSKCVERRWYAEMLFYDGILHFGYPSEWIKKAEEGNVGQGDLLEGVYTNENKFWNFFRRWFPRLVRDRDNGTKYLRSRSNMSGPLHEMEFVPLMNLLGATYNFRMKCTLNGREAVAYELMEEIYASDV